MWRSLSQTARRIGTMLSGRQFAMLLARGTLHRRSKAMPSLLCPRGNWGSICRPGRKYTSSLPTVQNVPPLSQCPHCGTVHFKKSCPHWTPKRGWSAWMGSTIMRHLRCWTGDLPSMRFCRSAVESLNLRRGRRFSSASFCSCCR